MRSRSIGQEAPGRTKSGTIPNHIPLSTSPIAAACSSRRFRQYCSAIIRLNLLTLLASGSRVPSSPRPFVARHRRVHRITTPGSRSVPVGRILPALAASGGHTDPLSRTGTPFVRTASTRSSSNEGIGSGGNKMSKDDTESAGGGGGTKLTYEVLARQDATSTNAIIDHFAALGQRGDPSSATQADLFDRLSIFQAESIMNRDSEDDTKLQRGIDLAIHKGVLQPLTADENERYIEVDVLGKTPDGIADEIWGDVVAEDGGESDGKGEVIVMCGKSGTGKGTTFARLGDKLRALNHDQVVNWSNGNIFRSITLLATRWCDNVGCSFDPDKALTKENLQSYMNMLEFGKYNGKYDTRINGLGLDLLVSDIQNTLLKQPSVAKNIPTVAEVTQGEVIQFANGAMKTLKAGGMTVLLEGREQTLNYIPTKHKFRLVMSDESLIGKRRAAQRLCGAVLEKAKDCDDKDSINVGDMLSEELEDMVDEMESDGE